MAQRLKVTKVYSSFTDGMQAVPAEIEVSLSPGIPTYTVIGQCDSSIKESRGRISAALVAAGFQMPKGHITVNISPAYLKKSGTSFDLPIAIGILMVSGQIFNQTGGGIYAEGELSLKGEVKGTPGAAFRLRCADDSNLGIRLIPTGEIEAAAYCGIEGKAIDNISCLNKVFGFDGYMAETFQKYPCFESPRDFIDVSELKGQDKTRRALLLSAAGFHNIMLLGSPGCGKTMAGKILAGLLPKLSDREASDVFALNNLLSTEEYSRVYRPLVYINQTTSPSALFGNSQTLMPGALTMANHGILYADEITEFSPKTIDSLRQPLEERIVRHTKNGKTYVFPANFIFACTGNPCKCGYAFEGRGKCKCSQALKARYLSKLSGPFTERIDLFSEMHGIDASAKKEMRGESDERLSPVYREMVSEAWARQNERYFGTYFNATFEDPEIYDYLRVSKDVFNYASDLSEKGFFSARGFSRILRVARTVADLEGRADVEISDVNEAAMFRKRFEV